VLARVPRSRERSAAARSGGVALGAKDDLKRPLVVAKRELGPPASSYGTAPPLARRSERALLTGARFAFCWGKS
jgi:hypothetical protein